MGHTNSTANIALPQFIGTDKPTWLGDVNGAFAAIDSKVGTIDADIAATDAKADTAIADSASAVATANLANTTAGNASTAATNASSIANNALTVANNADGHTNQLETKVGLLADLTTTDKTSIVNAINEVNGKGAGDISYDNSGSGLTATNVQDAIDEVAQGGGGGVGAWTLAGTQTGTVSIDISNLTYEELMIEVQLNGVNNYVVASVAKAMLSGTAKNYRTGYAVDGNTCGEAAFDVTIGAVALTDAFLSNNSVVANSVISVYYR